MKKCVVCDGEFMPSRRDVRYCSDACRSRAYAPPPTEKSEGTCPVCKSAFVGTARKKFCSRSCLETAKTRRRGTISPKSPEQILALRAARSAKASA